jgi:crotonobetainyl-CoA:carnitine CoA-transferase CaiB-like acyl-CoA transferase
MTGKTIDCVAGLLEGSGCSAPTVAAVRTVLASDGWATTSQACRALGVSLWTVRRMCERHGVRRVSRMGRGGSLVDLAGLRHVERTGEGQQVDMALLDTQVAMLANLGSNYLVSGKTPGRAGNAHQNIVPYQVFEVMAAPGAAPGSRDHLILAVGNDGQFAKFCAVAGCPDLAQDPRYAQNTNRVRHRDTLVPLLEGILKTRTKTDWLAALEAAKVPCGAINTLSEVFVDPQIQARGMVQQWHHPIKPDLKLVASPMKLSRTPVRQDFAPPMLGQHTSEVLHEVLGLSPEQQGALRGKGII